jgi:hypothetical protein
MRKRSSRGRKPICDFQNRAGWVQATYINSDTNWIVAKVGADSINRAVWYAKEASRFDGVKVDPVTARKLYLLKQGLVLPAASRPGASQELSDIAARLDTDYSTAKFTACFTITADDFYTAHHELGHNMYQRAYKNQPYLFRNGANDGFHEAIGDFAGLNALTPDYLRQLGLIDQVPGPQSDVPYLLRMALDKVPFLAFALIVDKWRWGVFCGQITPEHYNEAWWDLVARYQHLMPPGPRPPNAMLELGQSRPWPEALAAFSGERDIDASAIKDYFAPLSTWLDKQNKGNACTR